MINDVQKDLAASLTKAHEALKRELVKLRAGRANASLLDGIKVDYYGTPTPLNQMAHVNVPEPRLITVKPWDKSQIKAVDKALRESELGLNPQIDSDLIRLPLPPLTEERRKEFVKVVGKLAEEARVAVRNVRRDVLNEAKRAEKDGDISKNEISRIQDEVQKLTDAEIKHIDEQLHRKEAEILEV